MKAIDVDPKRVEELAARGLSVKQIALCLGIARSTLYRKFDEDQDIKDAVARGRAQGLQQVTNALFENALKGSYQAQQFYLRNRDPDRWKDVRDLSVTDQRKSVDQFSTEELAELVKDSKAA